jgi:putative membrane protein
MKRIASTGLLACAFLFGVAACNQEKKEDSVEQAQTANEEPAEGTETEETRDDQSEFMTKAASGGMMEVELGKLAQQNASSQQVKDFGTMMVTDHTKANDELKALAGKKSIVLPDSMSQEHMDHVKELRGKKAADFDKSYMDLMVEDHEEDVELFDEAAQNQQDPDVKAFASKTVTVLRKHQEQAKKTKDAVDKAGGNKTNASTPK